ncbi:MAG TPA: hypothetical protein VLD57_01705, partial [Blastocatellia bacterium]|nr:hypothetical protein [Blastocatellia bacterium]
GETEDFTVEDHVRTLYEYSPGLDLDYVIVNSARINDTLREKYLADGAVQVEFEPAVSESPGVGPAPALNTIPTSRRQFKLITGDLLNENDVVRHDPHKLARLLLEIHSSEETLSRRLAGVR